MKANSKMNVRRMKMIEFIRRSPVTTISDLADFFSVSTETIRKDIEYLDSKNLVVRIHGGVAPKEYKSNEPSFADRSAQNLVQKQKIAQAARDMIKPGDSIIIENGTTLQELTKLLAGDKELLNSLVIITMSFRIMEILQSSTYSNVFFLGGRVRKDDFMTCGHYTLSMLKQFHVDKAFIGGAGINTDLILTDYFDEEVVLRRQIIAAADKTFLLADSSKMNKTTIFSVCRLQDIYSLITDNGCPEEMKKLFAQNQINYQLV